MAIPIPAGAAPPSPSGPRRLHLVPPSTPPTEPCARTVDIQLRSASEHRTMAQRRQAHRRARTLCEDLAELLPQLTEARSLGDDGAYERKHLDAEVRATAGELAFWAARLCDRPRRITGEPCPQCLVTRCRCAIRDDGTVDLELLVELLDDHLGNAAHGYRDAPTRVLDLVGTLLASVDAATIPGPPAPPGAPLDPEHRCAQCRSVCDRLDDESGLGSCSAEHRLVARIARSAASPLRPGPVSVSTDDVASTAAGDVEA